MSEFLNNLIGMKTEPSEDKTNFGPRIAILKADLDQESQNPEAVRAVEIEHIRRSGLFDETFYRETYGDLSSEDSLEHFFDYGCKEDRRPNFYFEPQWYIQCYDDVATSGQNPLFHYVLYGDKESRNPGPLFVTKWYREQNSLPPDEIALAHYLKHRKSGLVSPFPDFDINFYAQNNQDVLSAGVDPFEHFVSYGYKEWRNPSPDFDMYFYVQRYLKNKPNQHPFFHWLANRGKPGVHGRMPDDEPSIPREIKKFVRPSPYFEEYKPVPATAPRRAKVLAYYLPQFHAFPENDKWWGAGFTEWTNIPRGVPRFAGHYQPRVPRDLGYYNLNGTDLMRRQIEMAKGNGLYGFIFYHYWFNGKRLMEKPLEAMMSDPTLDMPFSLMWANENWTRRWDGSESEILISQNYRPEDNESMVADFARHFKDSRYIRLNGRPLLTIYRPGIIPSCESTVALWRNMFRDNHKENPLIFMVQAFGDTDPRPYGLDGAMEFPPHKLTQTMRPANQDFELLDWEFVGKIYHYDAVVLQSLDEPAPPYPLIKTAVPSWDNDARRQGNGLVLAGSKPATYQTWLNELVERAEKHHCLGEAIVCINAWNEWCEGAYLEPDLHFGSAYLNATGRAICGISKRSDAVPKILLVGHDCFPSGAQHLLLNIGQSLLKMFGVEIRFLLLDGGQLEKKYKETAPVFVPSSQSLLQEQLSLYRMEGFNTAIVNTIASARVVPELTRLGITSVLLVHELPRLLKEKNLFDDARKGLIGANTIVFPAKYVLEAVFNVLDMLPTGKEVVQAQGSYKSIRPQPEAEDTFRSDVGINASEPIVLGVGYADLRKGFDLFLQLWRLLNSGPGVPVHFCWLGGIDPELARWLDGDLKIAERSGTFHMLGFLDDVVPAYSAAAVFALTSREDPFPTVVLEAVSAGVPVAAFAESGGMPELIEAHNLGGVVPHGDTVAMAELIRHLIGVSKCEPARTERRKVIDDFFSFPKYIEKLFGLTLAEPPKVSVAIPNYNYARYMPERLGSIFRQTYPVGEIIVLDDNSTDNSINIIRQIAQDWNREISLVVNEENSGSVFAQWRKAAELASGDWIWIAEADDSTQPAFLESVMNLVRGDSSIVMTFSDSRTIHADGSPQWTTYKGYYATTEPDALAKTEVFDARDFILRFLGVKNLILNVSAVVWNRKALLSALGECEMELKSFKMAGDWRLYLQALSFPEARVAYHSAPLNVHRRHSGSVTHSLAVEKHLAEITRCHRVARIILKDDLGLMRRQQDYVVEVAKSLGVGEALRKGQDRDMEPSQEDIGESVHTAANI